VVVGFGRMLEEHRRGDLLNRTAEPEISSVELSSH
jgi:hypothetical protein